MNEAPQTKNGRRADAPATATTGTPRKAPRKAPNQDSITVTKAIELGIESSSGNAYHIGRTRASARQFVRYLKERHSDLQLYSDLKPQHLRGFVSWCNERMLSPTTTRNYLNPIRLASRYVEENAPEQFNQLFFRRIVPTARIAPKRFLTIDRLAATIAMARKRADHTAVFTLMLGGLAGLRFEEIVQLRAEDVRDDLTLSTGTKNQYSERLIPITKPVYEYAKLFLCFYGDKPFACLEALSKAMNRTLKRMYKQTGDETYNLLKPRDCCRKTLWNLAADHGVQVEYLRSYCGHSAGNSVAEKHYLALTPMVDDMPDLQAIKLAAMRREVTDKLEAVIAGAGIK